MTKTKKSDSLQKEVLSLASDDVRSKIRTRFIKGWDIKTILDDLGIPDGTFDSALWRNTQGLQDFMTELKKEYFLKVTEAVSKEILLMDTEDNAKMLAIKQKEAEFIRETLLKDSGYSKRIETIGLNINKNEPLDDDQLDKLDRLLERAGHTSISDVQIVQSEEK